MLSHFKPRFRNSSAFTFVEAVFTIAIIGIMSALALSAVSNGARDANRIVARQQQTVLNEALVSWVMANTRVKDNSGNETAQVRSLSSLRTFYNGLLTTSARFNLLVPNPASSDPSVRNGFIDKTTADHFLEYTTGTDRLYSKALKGSSQYFALPNWQDGGFPMVDMVNETQR
jgi:type II secretory pathway pseudopilin PulG